MSHLRLALPVLVLCVTQCRVEPVVRPECVVVAATTDTHGVVGPQILEVENQRLRHSGVLAASGYVSALRQRFRHRLLLLDAGDLYQGTLVAKVSHGEAIVLAYNVMGYDAAAVGNHEFDYGSLESIPEDLQGVLKARLKQAKFPFLAANIVDRSTKKLPAWPNLAPSVLTDLGGVPVGIVGVTTTTVPRVTRPQLVANLDFVDPAPIVAKEARELRANGAQLVVLLAHLGGKCTKLNDPNNLSSCQADSELFALLARLPRGTIDVALGGHTHQAVAHWYGDTAVLQPLAQGKQLGWAEICVRPQGGIDRAASKIHPPLDLCLDEWADGGCRRRATPTAVVPAQFLGAPVVPQPDLEALLKPYLQAVEEKGDRPLGVRLPRPLRRETDGVTLGDRICEAMVESTGAQIAVQNLGGVRADLPSGELTFGDVFEVLPFENRIVMIDLTGEQVRALIDLLVKRREGLPPFVAGLAVRTRPEGTEVKLANGMPLVDDQLFTVATNDYLATGGEGADLIFAQVPPERIRMSDATILDTFIAFLQKRFPYERRR